MLGRIPYLGDTGKLGKWALQAVTDNRYQHIVDAMNTCTRLRHQMALLAQIKALQQMRKEMWEYQQRHKRSDDRALYKKAGRPVQLTTTA